MDKHLEPFKITFPYWDNYEFKVGNVAEVDTTDPMFGISMEFKCKYNSFIIAAITAAYGDGFTYFTVEGLCKEV